MLQGNMGVPFGGPNLRMAEEFLNDPKVDVAAHEMGRNAVAEQARVNVPCDPGFLAGSGDRLCDIINWFP